jgi:uncharacterized membrane protein (UPF0127 family)
MPPRRAAGLTLGWAFLALSTAACWRNDASREDATTARQPTVTFHTADGDIPILVEVVDEPRARAKGMMYRRHLPRNHGMVFVFPAEEIQRFWMKNTYLALDIIFIDAGLDVVGVVADAEPLTETSRSIGKPATFAVEVNAGFAAEMKIEPGVRVSMQDVPRSTPR